jgi:2-iminobutanoate/2-iminopropanoate deaminase
VIKTIYIDKNLLYTGFNEKKIIKKGLTMKAITSIKAPCAIGPYSQAVEKDGFIFVSGQLPIDEMTGDFSGTDISSQAKQSLENTKYILEEAGLEMKDIIKTTILLKNIEDFAVVNEIYGQYFSAPFPARATYEVSRLPKDALIEIESIAKK